jgi:hypothetical protein
MARENYCHFVNGEQDFLEPPWDNNERCMNYEFNGLKWGI